MRPYRERVVEAGDEVGVGAAGGEAVPLAERLQLPPLHPREIHPCTALTPKPPEITTTQPSRRRPARVWASDLVRSKFGGGRLDDDAIQSGLALSFGERWGIDPEWECG